MRRRPAPGHNAPRGRRGPEASASPLRMWTPGTERAPSPLMVQSALGSPPRGATPASPRAVQSRSMSPVAAESAECVNLQRDLHLARTETSFYSAIVMQRLEDYFACLCEIATDHMGLVESGVLPDASARLVGQRDRELLALKAELASAESRLVTLHTEASEQLEESQGQLSATLTEKASLFRSSQVSRLECAALRADHTSSQRKIEALEMTLREQSHRVERQTLLHSQAIEEARMEAAAKVSECECQRVELVKTSARLKRDRDRLQRQLDEAEEQAKLDAAERSRLQRDLEKGRSATQAALSAEQSAERLNEALRRTTADCAALRVELDSQHIETTRLTHALRHAQHTACVSEQESCALRAELMSLRHAIEVSTPQPDTPHPPTTPVRDLVAERPHAAPACTEEELLSQEGVQRATLQSEWTATSACLAAGHDALVAALCEAACAAAEHASLEARCRTREADLSNTATSLKERLSRADTYAKEAAARAEEARDMLVREKQVSAKLLSKIEALADELARAEEEAAASQRSGAAEVASLNALATTLRVDIAALQGSALDAEGQLREAESRAAGASGEVSAERRRSAEANTLALQWQARAEGLEAELEASRVDADRARVALDRKTVDADAMAQREAVARRHARQAESAHTRVAEEHAESAGVVQQILRDYEAIVGTDTVGQSTHSRADATNRFMVKFRAWYRSTLAHPPPQPAASRTWSPSPPGERAGARGVGAGRAGSGSQGGASPSLGRRSTGSSPLQAWARPSTSLSVARSPSPAPSL